MFKNVASQTISLLVIDTATNLPKTGDSANLTFYYKLDGGSVTVLTASPTEDSATNAPGIYTATLTQAETNGDKINFTGKSSTSDVRVVPMVVYTMPQYFSSLGINSSGHLSRVTLADTLTTLTNLPAITANWLTAAGLATDAVTEIQSGLATASALSTVAGYLDTEIAAILADTNELQTDWANGGRLDNILDARASQASVDTVDTVVDSILVDTNELQTDWVNGGRLDLILDARASQTSVDTVDTVVDSILVAVGDVPTNAELATALASADDAVLAAVATVDSIVDAIKVTTDKVDDTLEDDAGTYRFTTNALEQAPSGGSITVQDIVDGVLDEALSTHLTSGSVGAGINAASSAGDPWATTLPGAYGAGSAGKIIGDNVNATISSRASQTSVDTVAGYLDTEVAAIKAKTDNLPTDPADASDIAASFSTVNGTLATIATYIDTEVAAIKAKTDSLPSDPADASDIAAAFVTVNSKLDTIDTVVDAILVDTGTTLQSELDGIQADTEDIQSRIPLALVSGRMDSSIGAAAANTINASALAADAVTEIQSGLATAANLATVAGYLDTEIAAIVTSTGTTIPAQIAALNNLSSGQVVAALGTGSWASAIPWNAAWDAEVQSECTDALNAYDPPTRAELTTDTNSVLTAVGDVPTNAELATALSAADDAVLAAVGTVDTVVDAIKVKTDQFVFTVAGQVDANALSGGGGLDAAGVRTAVGLPAADLGDRLDSIKTDTGTTLPAVIAAALATQQIYVSDVL